MNGRLFYSIRWKLIGLFVASLALSVSSLIGVIVVLYALSSAGIDFPAQVAVGLRNMFGMTALVVMSGFFFFVIYIIVLSHRRVLYLIRITEAVQRIASGRFDERVPVRYNDEMGELAANLNKMSEQLKASIEEERRAERTKTELVTNVSHDLRTPLTSIEGYLGLIEQDRYRDEVELRHYVHIAYEKTKRLHVLIDDLFEYTRLRGSGLPLRKTQLDLVELIGQLAGQFQYEMSRAGMEVRLHVPGSRAMVEADGDKLARVFDNLLANAVRYGKEGIYVDVFVRDSEKEASVEIVNYGEPIPPEDMPYIFERFYRVEKSRSDDTGGSGLGLAIAKQIVELHGGTIRASSDQSRTVFEVKLPKCDKLTGNR